MASKADMILLETDRGQVSDNADYDSQLVNHARKLRKTRKGDLLDGIDGQSYLDLVDPARSTLAYAVTLSAYHDATAGTGVNANIVTAIERFLTTFDPVQARYVGQEWQSIVEWATYIAQQASQPQLLNSVRTAILRMDPSSSTFTINHLRFVQACLQLHLPRLTLPILEKDIYAIPVDPIDGIDDFLACEQHELSSQYITKSSKIAGEITIQDVQEYYLLSAFIYTGLRRFERAKLSLELALAVPTTQGAVDQYMVEAYKKLLITGLIAQGQAYKTSHLAEAASLRTMAQLSKPYEALIEAFGRRDVQKYQAEVDAVGDIWQTDGNLALVQEAGESLRRNRVIDLQRTHAAIHISTVASDLRLSPDSTTQLLQTMIQNGHLDATITTSPKSQEPILRFHTSSSISPPQEDISATIQTQIQSIETLSTFVREADRQLLLTKEYQHWARRNKKSGLAGGGDPGAAAFEDPMELSYDFPNGGGGEAGMNEDDEDIMAA